MAIGAILGIGSSVIGFFSKKAKKKKALAQAKADNAARLAAQKAELNRQMAFEAQKSKKTMMMVAIVGGGGLLLFLMFFMKK